MERTVHSFGLSPISEGETRECSPDYTIDLAQTSTTHFTSTQVMSSVSEYQMPYACGKKCLKELRDFAKDIQMLLWKVWNAV